MTTETVAQTAPIPTAIQANNDTPKTGTMTTGESVPMQTTPPVVVPVKTEPKVDSSKFAELSKREKQIAQKQIELKKQQEAVTKQQKEIEDFKNYRKEGKIDPDKALELLGTNFEELTKARIEKRPIQKKVEPIDPDKILEEAEKRALAKFEEKQNLTEQEKQNQENYNKAIGMIKTEIEMPEKYQFLSAEQDPVTIVKDVILQAWAVNKVQLTIEEAAGKTEKYLASQVDRYLENKAVQKVLEAKGYKRVAIDEKKVNNGTEGKTDNQATQSKQPPTTLTNKSTQAPTSVKERQLSREERISQIVHKHAG